MDRSTLIDTKLDFENNNEPEKDSDKMPGDANKMFETLVFEHWNFEIEFQINFLSWISCPPAVSGVEPNRGQDTKRRGPRQGGYEVQLINRNLFKLVGDCCTS